MTATGKQEELEFYFEFSSPYAYFASLEVEALCRRNGLRLMWRPVMLGGILKQTGQKPLLTDGVRGEYSTMDCLRWARRAAIPFRIPEPFPVNSLKAARGVLLFHDRQWLAAYIHACFRAVWAEGKDPYADETMAEIVAGLGQDAEAFLAGIEEPAIKQRLKDETEAARLRGVFGAPTFFFQDEMMWGNDRMPLLEEIIAEEIIRERTGAREKEGGK